MIPQPKKIKRTEGAAPQGSLAEERICPELGAEEYRISISKEGIRLAGSGETACPGGRKAWPRLLWRWGLQK